MGMSYARRRQSLIVWLVVLASANLSGKARASWVVDESGQCVNRWAIADLARGPVAIVNAPLLPIRSAVGGVWLVWTESKDGRAWKILLYGVPVGLISGTLGILEGLVWAVGGVADTATAGYFEIGTDDATQLSLMPVLPLFIPDSRRPRWAWGLEDRCGRPRVAPEPPPPTPGPLPPEKLRP